MPNPADRHRENGSTMTEEPDDVTHARDSGRNVGVSFGPRSTRRTLGDSWHDFVDRYGWRAYALPVLLIVTVAAFTTNQVVHRTATSTTATGSAQQQPPVSNPAPPVSNPAPPVASSSIPLKNDQARGNTNNTALTSKELPPGAPYTARGTGTFRVLKGTAPRVGAGRLYRYSIEVETGVTGVNLAQFQALVVSTLADKRSWSGHGVALQRVDSGPIDFRVTLTSAMTVRRLCGYDIHVETSCYAPAGWASPVNRVVLNVARWVRGSGAYVGNPALYRVYMINHEDGHALGHRHAHQCLPGGLAPVMMQQTFGLRSASTGKLCQANPWPYPVGAAGAPGAEQADTAANDEIGLAD